MKPLFNLPIANQVLRSILCERLKAILKTLMEIYQCDFRPRKSITKQTFALHKTMKLRNTSISVKVGRENSEPFYPARFQRTKRPPTRHHREHSVECFVKVSLGVPAVLSATDFESSHTGEQGQNEIYIVDKQEHASIRVADNGR